MTLPICTECAHRPSLTFTTSGRRLCEGCRQQLRRLTGTAVALAAGHGPAHAVAAGIATGAYTGAVERDQVYQRALRAKVAATEGFWSRMWVRIIG